MTEGEPVEKKRRGTPYLSKSRFTNGVQCLKWVYLGSYHPDLADQVGETQQAVFQTGTDVGTLARKLFAGGVLVEAPAFRFNDALKQTARALKDASVAAMFEPAFEYEDIHLRVDILVKAAGGAFDLIEVKSSSQVKDEHIPDAAVQCYVLEGCGLKLGRLCIAHLNRDYVYPGGEYDLTELIAVEDATARVREYLPGVPALLEEMRRVLGETKPPPVDVGRQCTNPYACAFFRHCHDGLPEHHILQLPRASASLLASLRAAGIEDIRQIPADFPGLNAVQKLVRDVVVSGECHIDDELPSELGKLKYPVHFLDFETFNPALPLYAGTRPYQIIPFQWSDHVLERKGQIRHEEYLHDGDDDPRRQFAESMLAALGTRGSVVVYSGFEVSRIKELALALPDLSPALAKVQTRVVDLLELVRKYCYHPLFHGSFSIKSVLPALIKSLSYDDLEIQEGGAASLAYSELINPSVSVERKAAIRRDLLAYCARDTEAEMELVGYFQTQTRNP